MESYPGNEGFKILTNEKWEGILSHFEIMNFSFFEFQANKMRIEEEKGTCAECHKRIPYNAIIFPSEEQIDLFGKPQWLCADCALNILKSVFISRSLRNAF